PAHHPPDHRTRSARRGRLSVVLGRRRLEFLGLRRWEPQAASWLHHGADVLLLARRGGPQAVPRRCRTPARVSWTDAVSARQSGHPVEKKIVAARASDAGAVLPA